MDATSAHQESLPVSSDALLRKLENLGLRYRRFDHVPLHTVAESLSLQSDTLPPADDPGHIKNLYLRDKKKRNYLVVAQQERIIDLKALALRIGAGRLSFGSADRLFEFLGVCPGAVTPLAMITGAANGVHLFIDSGLKEVDLIYAHPLVNDRTVGLSPGDLLSFLDAVGSGYEWVDFKDQHFIPSQ